MLIGAFSFVRILWIRFEIWRSPEDIDPSLPPTADTGLAKRPKQVRTFRNPGDVLRLFSPALSRSFIDKKLISEEARRTYSAVDGPRWKRYLVGWLPWLSLVSWFCEGGTIGNGEKKDDRRSSEVRE
jgi:hypothetical protein